VGIYVVQRLEGQFLVLAGQPGDLVTGEEHDPGAEAESDGGEQERERQVFQDVQLGGGIGRIPHLEIRGQEVGVLGQPALTQIEVAPAVAHAGGEIGHEDEVVLGEDVEALHQDVLVGEKEGEVAPMHGRHLAVHHQARIVRRAEDVESRDLRGAFDAEQGAKEAGQHGGGKQVRSVEDLPVHPVQDFAIDLMQGRHGRVLFLPLHQLAQQQVHQVVRVHAAHVGLHIQAHAVAQDVMGHAGA
jgi:hypothetical protein